MANKKTPPKKTASNIGTTPRPTSKQKKFYVYARDDKFKMRYLGTHLGKNASDAMQNLPAKLISSASTNKEDIVFIQVDKIQAYYPD